jgi:hypothetical protein
VVVVVGDVCVCVPRTPYSMGGGGASFAV